MEAWKRKSMNFWRMKQNYQKKLMSLSKKEIEE